MRKTVSIAVCKDYNEDCVRTALQQALNNIDGLDFVKPGMKIAIKANMLTFMNPDKAATTHPVLLTEVTKLLIEKGAEVIIGDSPGGIFSSMYVNRVYSVCGMREAEKAGAKLNDNFEQRMVHFPEAVAAKDFAYTSYLDDADAVINFCKLKTHGMMRLSNAVKNMFGVVPGTVKPEYHYRYPNHNDFADMLIDLNQYRIPELCITDAVVAMEGNGPRSGKPKGVGLILASQSPYTLDLVCGEMIGLGIESVPTLARANARGLAPANAKEVHIVNEDGNQIDIEDLLISDFELVEQKNVDFDDRKNNFIAKAFSRILRKIMAAHPALKPTECTGCGECFRICPAKAIKIKNSLPNIDREKCIDCFCCQEFCPHGAMIVKRSWLAKLLSKR